MRLEFRGVECRAGDFCLRLTAELRDGVTGFFGVSGSGKSTVVELLAGLRRPTAGAIALDGEILADVAQGIFLPPERRGMGFVPQEGALFPHLSVEQNLRFAERRRTGSEDKLFARKHVCEVLGIGELLARRPSTLSGGERQRVAVARALVSGPRLLLLDEPLAALDAGRKAAILPYLQRVRDEFGLSVIYVSHVPQEMMALCTDMAVLAEGRLLQFGPVAEVFGRPASPEVARIVGVETVFPGKVLGGEGDLVAVAVGSARLLALGGQLTPGTAEVFVSIRAEEVLLVPEGSVLGVSARNRLPAVVAAIIAEGATLRIELDCGFPLAVTLTRSAVEELGLVAGSRVVALIKAPCVHLIARA